MTFFFSSLPISLQISQENVVFLWLMPFIAMIVPVCILVGMEMRFLPYHSIAVTFWHRILILFDLALIWYFRSKTLWHLRKEKPEKPPVTEGVGQYDYSVELVAPEADTPAAVGKNDNNSQVLSLMGRCLLAVFTGAVLYYAFFTGAHYSSRADSGAKRLISPDIFAENLSLEEYGLINGEFPKDPSPYQPPGVHLTERNLTGADFVRANLVNADLRGADLSRANLDKADLRFARLSPSRGEDSILEMLRSDYSTVERRKKSILMYVSHLRQVNLRGADLRNADLRMADLRGADLESAKLDGADLRLADLREANLRSASLNGAKLSRSLLNRADLREAKLMNAELEGAHLIGADLWRSKIHGANLGQADLREAKFVEAEAMQVNFSDAKVTGADFQNAWLNASSGLSLHGIDLRGAHLQKLNICSESYDNFEGDETMVGGDLRSADFEDFPPGASSVSSQAQDEGQALQHLLSQSTCQDKSQVDKRHPLYSGTLEAMTEEKYHGELARMLVEQACQDSELVKALFRELSGESVPRRRLLAVAIARSIERQNLRQCPAFRRLSKIQWSVVGRVARERPLELGDQLP